jgi:hypothetical protein
MVPLSVLAMCLYLSAPSEADLDRALDQVEPPPALRASFRAELSTDRAVRRIEFDPYAPSGSRFRTIRVSGDDPELDAVVEGWAAERQPDVRLFADDLRASLGEGRVVEEDGGWRLEFRHRISPNDGAVDAAVSSAMIGRLGLDPASGRLTDVSYSILSPVRLEDGLVLLSYRQTYGFGYSRRWGVGYVSSYEVEARGGRWGIAQTRRLKVSILDVAFGLAGDAGQDLASRAPTWLSAALP